jgi:hypothetical protein
MPMSIAGLPSGVGGQGRTQYFNFQYDDSLSAGRGRDLAADLMNYCDNDLAQLSGWFSGRALDMSPPITVSIVNAATDAAGNPTQRLGASWYGALAWPLQVTITIGEFPMTSGTPTMLARYLLVMEVSEMYMRAINATGFTNPWFRTFSEGNKGEALSRFLALQFLVRAYPGVSAVPGLMFPSGGAFWNVTQLWLDSPRADWLEVNDEDIIPDAVIGCGTLFLFYLYDQLGYRIEDIINAGGGHLSNVYQNLTGDSAFNAFGLFSGLANSHYPHAALPAGGFTPRYPCPLESIFPVSDLTAFSATPQVSWVKAATAPAVVVSVDHPAKLPLAIGITSSHPAIIPPPSVTIPAGSTSVVSPFTVLPQGAGFMSQLVTLTASYAGKTRTSNVSVVSPETKGLPELTITADRSADPCRPLFVENSEDVFEVRNLYVFADQTGLSFSWSVTGAVSGATNKRTLTIPSLPAAGTGVKISVTVTNAQGLSAKGFLSFETVALDLKVLDRELRCRLSRFRNYILFVPEWKLIEEVEVWDEQLIAIETEMLAAAEAMESVKSVIGRMKQR